MIRSHSNAKVKLVRALGGRSRERREAGAFLAEGVRLIEEALSSEWPFRFVLHADDLSERGRSLLAEMRGRGIDIDEVDPKLLGSVAGTETSQGLLAVLEDQTVPLARDLEFVLIADAIRDPGNLGALLRTAEAAGVEAVFLAPGTTDAFAPKALRAGMGAHFRLPIFEISWDEIRTQATTYDWNLYLADAEGRSCWETEFRHPLAVIIGGEAEGPTAVARSLATETVSIPMQGRTESLNAAVAGSVLMFEVARRRKSDTPGAK